MNYETLHIEKNGRVCTVTVNRPEKLNALNAQTLSELKAVFTALSEDKEIGAVVLTGSGGKAFVAGADIAELRACDVSSGKPFSEFGQSVFDTIANLNKPVLAAVNGFALGGGCELAMACHIRYASENAKFGQPEVNLGIIPGYGGTQRLPRMINSGRALEYILTGDMFDAQEAFRLGLVSRIFPAAELLSSVQAIAEKISSKPFHAVRLALESAMAAAELSLKQGQTYEAGQFAVCCGTEDFKEGTAAFLEKRKPAFRHF